MFGRCPSPSSGVGLEKADSDFLALDMTAPSNAFPQRWEGVGGVSPSSCALAAWRPFFSRWKVMPDIVVLPRGLAFPPLGVRPTPGDGTVSSGFSGVTASTFTATLDPCFLICASFFLRSISAARASEAAFSFSALTMAASFSGLYISVLRSWSRRTDTLGVVDLYVSVSTPSCGRPAPLSISETEVVRCLYLRSWMQAGPSIGLSAALRANKPSATM
mmetsp:Transcript_23018/g.53812  ORF Transcript_23018/g.53812 Transcript_23018/m.53812 type:complete len:218 (-) Transcript_23018:890-1543(-)